MKVKQFIPTFLLMMVIAATAYAIGNKGLPELFDFDDEKPTTAAEDSEQVSEPPLAELREKIQHNLDQLDGDVQIESIEVSQVPGVYWVGLSVNEMLLVSADGEYVLGTSMRRFSEGSLEPVFSKTVTKQKAEAQNEIVKSFSGSGDEQLVYEAKGDKIGEVFVFTDVKCGYCRKFHRDVPELNEAGIEVRYFAGPFYSRDAESLEKIWCSEQPLQAMTDAKAGKAITGVEVSSYCKDVVAKHTALGRKLGIRGTPAIFTKDGQQIGGYIEPQHLIARFSNK